MDQVQVFTDENGFLALVGDFDFLHYKSITWLLVVPFLGDGRCGRDRVIDKHGLYEAQPVVSIRHGDRVDVFRSRTDGDAEDQCAMRDPLLKVLGCTPFCIHVVGKEVSRLPCMDDDVRFSYGTAASGPRETNFVFLKVDFLCFHKL